MSGILLLVLTLKLAHDVIVTQQAVMYFLWQCGTYLCVRLLQGLECVHLVLSHYVFTVTCKASGYVSAFPVMFTCPLVLVSVCVRACVWTYRGVLICTFPHVCV
jgi:hypothetical protein